MASPFLSITLTRQRLSTYIFWRTASNFWNLDLQPIIFVKTFNYFIFSFAGVLRWNSCFWKNSNDFLMKVMMGWILVLIRRFIPNNTKKCFVKYQNRIIKNPLQIHAVCELCLWGKIDHQQKKSLSQVLFLYYQGLERHPHKYHLKP